MAYFSLPFFCERSYLVVRAFASHTSSAATDSRDGPRRICRVRASIEIPGHAPLPGRTLDVGQGGMGLLAAHALPGGMNCRVRFSLFIQSAIHHFDLPAQTVASIFLRDDVRLSLRFTQVPPASAKLLGDYVRFQLS